MTRNKERIPREEKKAEAIRRMKIMGISEEGIIRFKESGLIPSYITGSDLDVAFYEPFHEDRICRLEKEHNILIYCIITTVTEFGILEAYVFVSDYKEEWKDDITDLKDGYALSWCENLTYPECSEMGSIGFEKQPSGAIWRTA